MSTNLKQEKTKNWASKILKDLGDFEITLSMNQLENTPSEAWKELIKVQTCKNALKHLNDNIGSKSRNYTELKMSNFLCSHDNFSIDTVKFIAKAQCHMIENIKMNFQQDHKEDLICDSCRLKVCNQSHLLYCEALLGSNQLITYIPNYEDIFNDENIDEQCFIANILMTNLKRKKEIESLKI